MPMKKDSVLKKINDKRRQIVKKIVGRQPKIKISDVSEIKTQGEIKEIHTAVEDAHGTPLKEMEKVVAAKRRDAANRKDKSPEKEQLSQLGPEALDPAIQKNPEMEIIYVVLTPSPVYYGTEKDQKNYFLQALTDVKFTLDRRLEVNRTNKQAIDYFTDYEDAFLDAEFTAEHGAGGIKKDKKIDPKSLVIATISVPSAILDKDNEYIERAISHQIKDKSLIQVHSVKNYLQIQEELTGKNEEEKERYFKERTDLSGPSKEIESKEAEEKIIFSKPKSSEQNRLDESLSKESISPAMGNLNSEPIIKSAMKKTVEPQQMKVANFDTDVSEEKKKTSIFSSLRERIKRAFDNRKERKKQDKQKKEAISKDILSKLSKLKDIEKSISGNTEEQDNEALEKASSLKEAIESIRATKYFEKSDTIFFQTEAAIAKANTINKKIENKINKKQEAKSLQDARPTINPFYKLHQAKEDGKKSKIGSEQDIQPTQKEKIKPR